MLSTKPTLATLRASVRRELLDPTGKWWSNAELDGYINDWQQSLQSQFEFVWGVSTITTTDTSISLSTFTGTPMMRLDAIYFCAGGTDTCTSRMAPRTMSDLDTLQRDWRGVTNPEGVLPCVSYQTDANSVAFFPPPNGTSTYQYEFEYPVLCTMTVGTNTMQIPAWTQFSVIPYCLYRAYSRFGPAQDLRKAGRRRRQWDRKLSRIKSTWDAFLPDKAEQLRPGRRWASDILRTRPGWPPR